VKEALSHFPQVSLSCSASPITRTVLRITTTVVPEFRWRDQVHGQVMRWLLWVEDSDTEVIYHHDMWMLNRKMMQVRPPDLLLFSVRQRQLLAHRRSIS
jgi:hypothetical protein